MSIDSLSAQPTSRGILPSNVHSVDAEEAIASTTAVTLTTRSPATVAVLSPDRQCPTCRRSWGAARSCQFCRQVEGLPIGVTLASPARRFGGWFLDGLLVVLT